MLVYHQAVLGWLLAKIFWGTYASTLAKVIVWAPISMF